MCQDFRQRLLRHTLEVREVFAQFIVLSTKLLDLVPHFVIVVAADSLSHVKRLGEVTEIDGSMIAQEEICEIQCALHLTLILRIDMILETHLHQ